MITNITINHIIEPVGFDFSSLRIGFEIKQKIDFASLRKQLIIMSDGESIYTSEIIELEECVFFPEIDLLPRTKYVVIINVFNEDEILTGETWFETGKMQEKFSANWLGGKKHVANNIFKKQINLEKPVKSARLYASALGVYEVYFDGIKISDEILAPGFTTYNQWVQVQTYALNEHLNKGIHSLEISVGDGWYKGNMGFEGGQENIYGDQQAIIAELHIRYFDGTTEIINSDSTWNLLIGSITKSSIYYGEDIDATSVSAEVDKVELIQPEINLVDRLSLPMRVMKEFPAIEMIKSAAGETILDFGQNLVGWVAFNNSAGHGNELLLEFGEILQDGNFYRENLREARAAFSYISDGKKEWVRPHFTYFGFRYVRLTGFENFKIEDFKAQIIYSDMPITGSLQTDNIDVNRLFENVLWGQKGNFLDVPTDCPQRDERLGWTGDAQIFSKTALYNMNAYPFFRKFMRDMQVEQTRLGGKLPMYAPALEAPMGGAAVWSDAITIIPWNSYQMTGDYSMIKEYYSAMKSWVNWVQKQEQAEKHNHLWLDDFQFGDWLALDGDDPSLPTGKTEEGFIASIYYYYSVTILSKSAQLLNYASDFEYYNDLAKKIRLAIQTEYLTATGRLALTTQTAYALMLYFDLVPKEMVERLLNDFIKQLKKDNYHLTTGFVGTPIVCTVLSQNNQHDLAMRIFMNDDYPSWLYAVKLGATTIWERWNSVLPDGSMNPEGMNSLNHYAYGSIMEWGYQSLLGIVATTPGFKTVTITPGISGRLKYVCGHFDSSYGRIAIKWSAKESSVKLELMIPNGVKAKLNLPRLGTEMLLNHQPTNLSNLVLTAGEYDISYQATTPFIDYYSLDMPIKELINSKELWEDLKSIDSTLSYFDIPNHMESFGEKTIAEACKLLPFISISDKNINRMRNVVISYPINYN